MIISQKGLKRMDFLGHSPAGATVCGSGRDEGSVSLLGIVESVLEFHLEPRIFTEFGLHDTDCFGYSRIFQLLWISFSWI
jgi:hypothetical protein